MLPRERFAWVWLVTLVLVFAVYFALVAQPWHAALPFLSKMGLLAVALCTLALVTGLDRLVAVLRGGAYRYSAPDERERLIAFRAGSTAYYVLMAGMIVVGVYLPFENRGAWELAHAGLLAIAISEVVNSGLIVLGYRRGLRV